MTLRLTSEITWASSAGKWAITLVLRIPHQTSPEKSPGRLIIVLLNWKPRPGPNILAIRSRRGRWEQWGDAVIEISDIKPRSQQKCSCL